MEQLSIIPAILIIVATILDIYACKKYSKDGFGLFKSKVYIVKSTLSNKKEIPIRIQIIYFTIVFLLLLWLVLWFIH